MFMIEKSSHVLIVLIVFIRCFKFANGIAFYKDDKVLPEDEKRGATSETKNEVSNTEELSSKSKTGKRGIPPGGLDGRHFISTELEPPEYDGYKPTRNSGNGGYANIIIEHLSDDRRPPFYEHNGEYQHSGGSFIADRPSGYGPSYGPIYLPPPKPIYYDGYDEGHRYPEQHGGDEDRGVGLFKALTVKKILLPLAGLAILGVAAAAVSHNPILLQLGTVNGRRKRALLLSDVYPPSPVVKPIRSK